MKEAIRKYLYFWIFSASFLYALPSYNKFWFPFDEGMTLVWAEIIRHGGIPYKDFVTLYGPIQSFMLALLFKILSPNLLVAHLYVLFIHAVVSTVVFYLAYKISQDLKYGFLAWLVGLTCFAPRMGAAATSMWPFMLFGSLSMLYFVRFIETHSYRHLIMASASAGLAMLGRYELGLYLMAAELIILLFTLDIPSAVLFLFSGAVIPCAFLLYMWKNNALGDLIFSILLPYKETIRYSQIVFPLPCLDLRQIFYGSLRFININQHYIPIIAYLVTAPTAVYLYFKKNIDYRNLMILLFITLAGISMFPYAYFGADTTHTMPVIFPAIILSAFILKKGGKVFYFVVLLLIVLLAIKNTDKYIKNVVVKPFTNKIILLNTPRGSVYVPKPEIDDVRDLVNFIRDNTDPREKIFITFDSHKEIVQGGFPMLYFLADRLPATKHFIMLPGNTNQEKIQREIVGSLKDVRFIILTSEGKVVLESARGQMGSEALDNYIRENYNLNKKIGKFDIYLKK